MLPTHTPGISLDLCRNATTVPAKTSSQITVENVEPYLLNEDLPTQEILSSILASGKSTITL